MTIYLARLALVLALSIPLAAQAQSTSDREVIAIDAAIAAYLRPSLPKAGVLFEPRVRMTTGQWQDIRSSARVSALALALGGSAASHDSVYTCGAMPSECTLRNASIMLSFTDPMITGNTAVVRMTTLFQTGIKRIPIGRRASEIRLERSGAAWRVVSSQVTSQS